jgi:alpha-L-arabinofuranosidase
MSIERYYLKDTLKAINYSGTMKFYQYPMLSDLIKDLCVILDKYGDHIVSMPCEWTDEITSMLYDKDEEKYGLDYSDKDIEVPYELDDSSFMSGLFKVLLGDQKKVYVKNIAMNGNDVDITLAGDNLDFDITLSSGNTIHIGGKYYKEKRNDS